MLAAGVTGIDTTPVVAVCDDDIVVGGTELVTVEVIAAGEVRVAVVGCEGVVGGEVVVTCEDVDGGGTIVGSAVVALVTRLVVILPTVDDVIV